MSELLIGCARVSTDVQDLTALRDALAALGVPLERLYVYHGLTGTSRERPGLREALAACRAGGTLHDGIRRLGRSSRAAPVWLAARVLQGRCAHSGGPACGRVPDPLRAAAFLCAMPDHIDDEIPLEQRLIFEDGELVFDGSDPGT